MSWMRGMLALLAAALSIGAAPSGERTTLIRGARIFDGSGTQARVGDVLVRGERIVAVGERLRAPPGTRLVNAKGLTLLPGLHDLHTHLRAPAIPAHEDLGKAYAGHLNHGVTSVNDFSVSGEMLQPIREMTSSGMVTAPNLQLAIRIGVPGGHGTEYGWGTSFTLEATTPRAGKLAMARALPYKPDVIKVFTDGWRYGRAPDLNSMNAPTLQAIVEEAHAAGIPVITHSVTLNGAKLAASAGVDALGHGIGDALVDDELIALMKRGGTAYVPTMVVYEPQQDRTLLRQEWQRLRAAERAEEEQGAGGGSEPVPELVAKRWSILRENLRRLKQAGIRVGIGTDAGIGGVYHGSSAIREIRLLSQHGFSPAEALQAATSISAGILRKAADHGRIAPGQRADLVLTGGRPDQSIVDLYDVRRVFVSGREISLPKLRQLMESPSLSPLPARIMAGPIDTGRGAEGRTDLGTLRVETHEAGTDHSRLHHSRSGAGADGPLLLVANLGAAPEPFTQLVLPLTRGGIERADARGFAGLSFEARGNGRYAMLIDSYGVEPRQAFRASFAAQADSREVRIPFSAFGSTDASARLALDQLRSVIVRLEGKPGEKASLELRNLRFYR